VTLGFSRPISAKRDRASQTAEKMPVQLWKRAASAARWTDKIQGFSPGLTVRVIEIYKGDANC